MANVVLYHQYVCTTCGWRGHGYDVEKSHEYSESGKLLSYKEYCPLCRRTTLKVDNGRK